MYHRCIRKISTTLLPRFEATTRVLTPESSAKTLRDLWYDSMYGSKPIKIMSYQRSTNKFVACSALVVAKGKNTVEEVVFTCGGTVQTPGTTKFCLDSEKSFVANEMLAPRDVLFTVTVDPVVKKSSDPTRILMSHSYRVEDTFELLTDNSQDSDNWIAMISDKTGIVVKANPTLFLSE